MALSEQQVEELKGKHGPIFQLTVGSGDEARSIVVRRPNRMEWKRFKQQARDESKRDVAALNLVKTVLLDPAPEQFDSWMDEFPGLDDSFGSEVVNLVGLTEKPEKKVL